MEYLSTDDMLPDILPGYHAIPGDPGLCGILQGMQMLCSTLPGKKLLKVLPGGQTLLESFQECCKLQNLPDRQTDPVTLERNVAHGMLLRTYKYRSNEVHEVQND